jgi:hypothetical protein
MTDSRNSMNPPGFPPWRVLNTQGDEAMSAIMKTEFLDRPPAGDWFALDVMREAPRKRRWVVLMIDVHPDELKHCRSKTAFLYVHPKDYRPDPGRTAQEARVRIPGKHRDRDSAWEILEYFLATRH